MSITRVRFAPSPTGTMHLGNVRTALINFLYARQKRGTFVLRIEDTDAQRMIDPDAQLLLQHLVWLGLTYDEGPGIEGEHSPYFQSKRIDIYQKYLAIFQENNLIYRCFCTEEELLKRRDRQIALKLPPRYDRTCMSLSPDTINRYLEENNPFIWRFRLDHTRSVTITDLAHGKTTFQLSNFSDFAISRQDGTFTFMFANFVDDLVMNITHVFRGEDHLSNTANQAAMFDALKIPLPIYWHMPILCNLEGKKLSKRDFGFSLVDLKNAGYLPEAINNYVGIIGGSFKEEIMTLDGLVEAFNFGAIHSTGRITYDLEKLNWVNKQWINRCDPTRLATLCYPFLEKDYGSVDTLDSAVIAPLLQKVKTDMTTLADSVNALHFYFNAPAITMADINACITASSIPLIKECIIESMSFLSDSTEFAQQIKKKAQEKKLSCKELYWFLRLGLMGKVNGPAIYELIDIIGEQEAQTRIERALNLL